MKEKKDVLIINQYFYPEYISSATLPYDMAKRFVEDGYTVSVLCGYPKEYTKGQTVPKREIVDGIEIQRLKYIQSGRKNFLGRILNFVSFAMQVALQFLSFKKYKVIYVYSLPPILPFFVSFFQKVYNLKIIHILYDTYPEIAIKTDYFSENSVLDKVMKITNKFAYSRFHQVLTISTDMSDFVIQNRNIPSSMVKEIPTWHEDKYTNEVRKPSDNKYFSDIPDDAFIVSYLGNMGKIQGIDTLLEGIQQVPETLNIYFVFAGHGARVNDIKELVKTGQLKNTKVYDMLLGEDFQDALAMSHCCVVSLVEGLLGLCSPSKTMAYFMKGKPVICMMDEKSDVAIHIRKYDGGYVVHSSIEFAEAVQDMYENPELCRKKGENSRALFLDNYEKNVCLKQHSDNLKLILDDFEK